MSKIIGNAVLMFADGQPIGCATSGTITIEGTEIETTCKDNNGAFTSVIGSDKWTGEVGGNFDDESGFGLSDLLALKKSKALVGIKMAVSDPVTQAEVSGGLYFIGYARLVNLTWSSDLNAPSTYSASFSGFGDWSYGTET
jgi:hypothetical protein